ncbi:hypothetical protein [Streptomyces yangpuensis]|uniref:hypothetical protein n=1 Tax=Streptomyces yangpuensis TaxID=1648182 RepID=UPI003649BAF7
MSEPQPVLACSCAPRHEAATAISVNGIARDLTAWRGARNFPGRANSQVSDF